MILSIDVQSGVVSAKLLPEVENLWIGQRAQEELRVVQMESGEWKIELNGSDMPEYSLQFEEEIEDVSIWAQNGWFVYLGGKNVSHILSCGPGEKQWSHVSSNSDFSMRSFSPVTNGFHFHNGRAAILLRSNKWLQDKPKIYRIYCDTAEVEPVVSMSKRILDIYKNSALGGVYGY